MNRKQTDIAAGVLILAILCIGVVTAIEMLLSDSGPMGQADSAPTMRVVGPVFMSLLLASVVGGVYVYARERLYGSERASPDERQEADSDPGPEDPDSAASRELLDLLPEDEQKILTPVIESPGLTQVAIRDRSGFSKSKVSQSITDLEARGLVYRERQGRTYRVYPADDIDDKH